MYRALETVAKRMYPGVDGAAHDVDRRHRHGAASRQGHPEPTASARAATESDRINYGAHSDVERLSESSLYRFVEFAWSGDQRRRDQEMTRTVDAVLHYLHFLH